MTNVFFPKKYKEGKHNIFRHVKSINNYSIYEKQVSLKKMLLRQFCVKVKI